MQKPVSYTHLDVYKRQTVDSVSDYEGNRTILVKPYADFDKISYVTLVGDGK